MNLYKILIMIMIIIILNEIYHTCNRQFERKKIYKQAMNRSKAINKPLVVVGDPYNGKGSKFFNKIFKPYGCGDDNLQSNLRLEFR